MNIQQLKAQWGTAPLPKQQQVQKQQTSERRSFQDTLKGAIEETHSLRVTKHAASRMKDRDIEMSPTDWNMMQQKVQEAKEKGVKESLVLFNDHAFIVNTQNKTVITAMNQADLQAQIFTNITGTIVLKN
ncbi:TIGR02530 family flagellar biosynthesis protein [Bacillus fonticola]|uniref:TIGR02530 family flagellar biosynthesis protein n=1 Tax=Bacillus fonticola TaxID=2728853 RepID=UPI001D14AB31|nr:TIGR02530 family flagellar biosynthesis protein [Bacillus fonticola]